METQNKEFGQKEVTEYLKSGEPVCGSGSVEVATLCIREYGGKVVISWAVGPNFPIGDSDLLALNVGNNFKQNWRVTARTGEITTEFVYGSGYNLSYWAKDVTLGQIRRLVTTPDTQIE